MNDDVRKGGNLARYIQHGYVIIPYGESKHSFNRTQASKRTVDT